MIPAFVCMILAGIVGWRRAARRGGNRADRMQYAAAHAIPAFLIVMLAMSLAGRMGLF